MILRTLIKPRVWQALRLHHVAFSTSAPLRILIKGNRTSLIHEVFHAPSKTPARDLLNFKPFAGYHPPSTITIKIRSSPLLETVELPLQEVLDQYIRPGYFLAPCAEEEWSDVYTVVNVLHWKYKSLRSDIQTSLQKRMTAPKYENAAQVVINSRMVRLDLKLPVDFQLRAMRKVYEKMEEGLWMHFMVHLPRTSQQKAEARLSQFGGDEMQRSVHLRPDVLLKALPENVGVVIQPQINASGVHFVVAPAESVSTFETRQPADQTYKLDERKEMVAGFKYYKGVQVVGGGTDALEAKRAAEAASRGFESWDVLHKHVIEEEKAAKKRNQVSRLPERTVEPPVLQDFRALYGMRQDAAGDVEDDYRGAFINVLEDTAEPGLQGSFGSPEVREDIIADRNEVKDDDEGAFINRLEETTKPGLQDSRSLPELRRDIIADRNKVKDDDEGSFINVLEETGQPETQELGDWHAMSEDVIIEDKVPKAISNAGEAAEKKTKKVPQALRKVAEAEGQQYSSWQERTKVLRADKKKRTMDSPLESASAKARAEGFEGYWDKKKAVRAEKIARKAENRERKDEEARAGGYKNWKDMKMAMGEEADNRLL